MKNIRHLLLISALAVLLWPAPSAAQNASGLLIPIGGGYSDIYAGFSTTAVANARDGQVKILVLPSAYSTNPLSISAAERQTNLRDAEERRYQLEEACKRAASPQVTCQAVLAPVFVRADAQDPATLNLFGDDLTAIFILGGDQTVAMQTIINTPLETRLAELNQKGVIVAGTSAGGGMLSASMLAGYNPNYAAGNAFNFGAADVWNTPEKHGLTFGLKSAILDQHFYQRGRLPRLLNAIALPGVPHLGVGVDAYTGVIAENETLRGVFGLYTTTILDAETYHAAEAVKYVEAAGKPPYLSLRNVLVNILSAGDFSYNLQTRTTQLGKTFVTPAPKIERSFEMLNAPGGAGILFISGGASENLTAGSPLLMKFLTQTGTTNAKIALVGIGYPNQTSANNALDLYAKILPGPVTKIIVNNGDPNPIKLPADLTGILLTGQDPSKVDLAALQTIKDAWLKGTPVLADNAAAGLMGAFYSAHGPISQDAEEQELATQKSFRQGKTKIQPGLGLLNAVFEPKLIDNNRWGRLFSLAYNHPDLLAVGLSEGTALEISAIGGIALGENPVFVLDLRQAKLALGKSDGFVIANGLLDVFAPGENIIPEIANIGAITNPAPTPVLPTPKPSATTTLPAKSTPAAAPTMIPATAVPPQPTPAAAPVPELQTQPAILGIISLVLIIGAGIYTFFRKRQNEHH